MTNKLRLGYVSKILAKFSNFLPFSRKKKVNFRKIGDSLEVFLKNWPKMVKFSKLFAKIQLENIGNFDETFNFPFFKDK